MILLRKPVLVCLLQAFGLAAGAQYWAGLAKGKPNVQGQVNVLYGDTVWDRLLMGGAFGLLDIGSDTVHCNGAGMWDGAGWDTLPQPVPYYDGTGVLGGPIFDFLRWKDVLYCVGGYTQLIGTEVNAAFSKWNPDSMRWDPLECINAYNGGMQVLVSTDDPDTSFITGYAGTLCGHPISNAFMYTGDTIMPWPPIFDFPWSNGDYTGRIFKYQGQYYMTGLRTDSITNISYSFMRYTGAAWEPVPGWNTLASIKDVVFHDDRIYVCGTFFTEQGAPGNMVAAFDGLQWDSLGGGMREGWPNGTLGYVQDLHWWRDTLYAVGQFNYIGDGALAHNAALWDGSKWCGLGGYFSNQVPGSGKLYTVTNWGDSLYVGGGFVTIDSDSMMSVARWLGNVENCSTPVGVQEQAQQQDMLLVWPNPAQAALYFNTNCAVQVRVVDTTGRVVLAEQLARGIALDVARLGSGCYMVLMRERDGTTRTARFVKE